MTTSKQLMELPLAAIHPDPNNPRKDFDPGELQCLADSIRETGLIQAIEVRPDGDRYILIAGERRYRAHQLLEAETILATVLHGADAELAALRQVTENLQRVDLNPLDEARGFQSAMDRYGLNQSQLATKLGVPRSKVAGALRLLRMASAVQQGLANGSLTAGHADAIGRLAHGEQTAAVAEITSQKLSVAATRRRLQQAATTDCPTSDTPGGGELEQAANPACPTSDTTIAAKPRHPALRALVKAMGAMPAPQELTDTDRDALRQVANALRGLAG